MKNIFGSILAISLLVTTPSDFNPIFVKLVYPVITEYTLAFIFAWVIAGAIANAIFEAKQLKPSPVQPND
jgi:hypothetical protein